MARRNLTAQRLRELLDYNADTGIFTSRRLCRPVGYLVPPKNYQRIVVDGQQWLAHRLAWLYVHGEWPADQIDHINGVRTDNRIANLRVVSARANMQNIRAPKANNRSSGLLGATWSARAQKWHAQINLDNKNINLGNYATAQEAHAAYLAAKRRLHEGCTI